VYERGEGLGRMIREWLTRKLFRRSSWSRFVVWWEKDRKVGGRRMYSCPREYSKSFPIVALRIVLVTWEWWRTIATIDGLYRHEDGERELRLPRIKAEC